MHLAKQYMMEILNMNNLNSSNLSLKFKFATEESEFQQIHGLNYKTFAEEIPQHQQNSIGILVDKYHEENTYIICLRGEKLGGMVAVRDKRPFSLDEKLDNLDSYLPEGVKSVCEIRLLSVDIEYRSGQVLKGLLTTLADYCITKGYDIAIISGTVRQQKLYKRLGFISFGPPVGNANALYQPMYTSPASIRGKYNTVPSPNLELSEKSVPVNLLPGPVKISRDIQKSFTEAPISHRTKEFVKAFNFTKHLLCNLVSANQVEIFMGSGTLANDVIAGQLSLDSTPGIILNNGEFGDRITDHARRFKLPFKQLKRPWGEPFERNDVTDTIDHNPDIKWLWAVHCETSTGMLNDIEFLKKVCQRHGINLVLDCISSIGTIPVDLNQVYLASCVSGKGLGSYPGLSMVFYNHAVHPAPKILPRYLDLGFQSEKGGIPFTISSNLLYALQTALQRFNSEDVFKHTVEVSTWIKSELRTIGFYPIVSDSHSTPAVITIPVPDNLKSDQLGEILELEGYLLSSNSSYLIERNWIQICLMGEFSRKTIFPLVDLLQKFGSAQMFLNI